MSTREAPTETEDPHHPQDQPPTKRQKQLQISAFSTPATGASTDGVDPAIHNNENNVQLYSGNVIRISPTGERVIYANLKIACADTPYSNRNTIGQCALGYKKNHARFQWEYERASEFEGECWKQDPMTGTMCSNMGRYYLRRSKTIDNIAFIHYGHPDLFGYMVYTWNKKTIRVHRMIARAFLGAAPLDTKGNAYDVDHKNGAKQDNHLSNLQYLSRLEHARKTRSTTSFDINPHTRDVERVSENFREIIKFDSVQKAAESVGIKTSGGVSSACRRSTIVGDWSVEYEEYAGKEVPEFGGFTNYQGCKRSVIATNLASGESCTYESASACAVALQYYQSQISQACGRSNYYKGYFWRYAHQSSASPINEEWRVSPSLPVEISSCGRVKMKNGCIVEDFSSWGNSSYMRYSGRFVHKLVAEAFFGPPPHDDNGRVYDVDHIDRNPANNHVSNLHYLSRLEHARKTHSISQRKPTHKRANSIDTGQPTHTPSVIKRGKDLYQRKRSGNSKLWDMKLQQVIAHINKEKKTPSEGSKDEDTRKLAQWIAHQRSNYSKRERIMKEEPIRNKWEHFVEIFFRDEPKG
jgi:hypothetical protein